MRELVGGATPVVVATAKPPVAAALAPAPKEPTVVAAAEPKPAPTPEKVAEKPADAEVLDTVNAWAKAWSSKNVEAYLAFYAKEFKTPGGEPRADWEKARRLRIGAPKSISVTVDSPKVSVAAEGRASVTFRQGYLSDVIKSTTTTKTLVLARSDGRWLIQQERVGN